MVYPVLCLMYNMFNQLIFFGSAENNDPGIICAWIFAFIRMNAADIKYQVINENKAINTSLCADRFFLFSAVAGHSMPAAKKK